MSSASLILRTMSRDEVTLAVDWAAEEGWNPGRSDAEAFYAADPEGFLIGTVGDRPVAVISAVRSGTTFGFIGFYIVRPEARGRGYGLAIWQAALERLAGRCVGLDGVLAQQEAYRKSGFVLAHRNIRTQGVGGGPVASDPRLVALTTLPFATVEQYDRAFFPAGRNAFLARWISLPGVVALGLLDTAGGLAGYGVLRPCAVGSKIGPLFADSVEGAEILRAALFGAAAPGAPVFLDIPEANPAAVALAQRHGLSPVFETARMYLGTPPEMALERTFGVTSFELG